MINSKSEMLNPKQYRNTKFEIRNGFDHLEFMIWDLFRISVLVFSIFVMLVTSTSADQAGTQLPVLSAGVGARALGMGGAFTAIADNADSPYWNPAGLSAVHFTEITTMQTKLSTDADHFYVSYAVPWGRGALGISWIQVGLGGISQTAGAVDPYNEVTTLGVFNYYSNAYMLSYGLPVNDKLSIGLTAKYLTTDMGSVTGGQATGYSISPGILLTPLSTFTIGAKIDELVNSQDWGTGASEKVDPKVRLGFALRPVLAGILKGSTFALDMSQIFNSKYAATYSAGYEWQHDALAFRLGYADSSITAGAGFTAPLPDTKTGFASVDYAYLQQSSLSKDNVHRVSLSGKW